MLTHSPVPAPLPTDFTPLSFSSPPTAVSGPGDNDNDNDGIRAGLIRSASIQFPSNEPWVSLLVTPCSFAPVHFNYVMENLLRNPNLTSTSLFRADVLYDSEKDPDAALSDDHDEVTGLVKYMKQELRPTRRTSFDSYAKRRVVVRNLVPRNPSLDKELVQTVWFLGKKQLVCATGEHWDQSTTIEEEKNLVIYVPHAADSDSIPYYHPKVHSIALLHTFDPNSHTASLSIHYRLFSPTMSPSPAPSLSESFLTHPPLTKRLQRTALNLLRIIHKHAHGQQAGYKKRVHHDLLVDQVTFQDTYVRLKQKYAKSLMETWAEVTDPKKHVFEDIGIAAFLIEIWRGMYGNKKRRDSPKLCGLMRPHKSDNKLSEFPGFVDIGCGNGVLVYILLSEGYEGWGFDVRRRKSWSVFPKAVQDNLKELVLVPEVLRLALSSSEDLEFLDTAGIHNGIFPSGTFIVSNHADQLTPWTPLLAYSSNSPFISIPCCSHALNGKLSRFYDAMPESENHRTVNEKSCSSKSSIETSQSDSGDEKLSEAARGETPEQLDADHSVTDSIESLSISRVVEQDGPGPQTGSLARSPMLGNKSSVPSAYAGFTAYVMRIAAELGYKVESEILRIPSTRNLSIVSRQPPVASVNEKGSALTQQDRDERLLQLLRMEVGDVSLAAKEWIQGAISIKRKAGGAH